MDKRLEWLESAGDAAKYSNESSLSRIKELSESINNKISSADIPYRLNSLEDKGDQFDLTMKDATASIESLSALVSNMNQTNSNGAADGDNDRIERLLTKINNLETSIAELKPPEDEVRTNSELSLQPIYTSLESFGTMLSTISDSNSSMLLQIERLTHYIQTNTQYSREPANTRTPVEINNSQINHGTPSTETIDHYLNDVRNKPSPSSSTNAHETPTVIEDGADITKVPTENPDYSNISSSIEENDTDDVLQQTNDTGKNEIAPRLIPGREEYSKIAENSGQRRPDTQSSHMSNTASFKQRRMDTPRRHSRYRTLLLHDSMLKWFRPSRFCPLFDVKRLRVGTLKNLSDPVTLREIRSFSRIDSYLIHLGVNDLKHDNPASAIEYLRNAIHHLLKTNKNAKVIFSLVLPTMPHQLTKNIDLFNHLATELITELRSLPEGKNRIFTSFNTGFVRHNVDDIKNMYEDDCKHLNESDGTAKLSLYFKRILMKAHRPNLQQANRYHYDY